MNRKKSSKKKERYKWQITMGILQMCRKSIIVMRVKRREKWACKQLPGMLNLCFVFTFAILLFTNCAVVKNDEQLTGKKRKIKKDCL